MIHLKIKAGDNMIKHISLIKAFDKSLSLGVIKQRIENNEIVMSHDIYSFQDICDEQDGIDRNLMFRKLITDLIENNAEIEILEDEEAISIEILDNMFEQWNQIEQETQRDIDRELS